MKRIVYITATLPALTVTFIYNEIFRLRSAGMKVDTVSMNTPPDDQISAAARQLKETTLYLDSVGLAAKLAAFAVCAVRHPLRTARCLRHVLTAHPMQGARDYARLIYHLIEAAYLARRMRHKPPGHLHSHFINGPTSIAMFLGKLLDVPYSFTMHASMIWLDPIAFANKLRTAAFCVSISEYNRQYVLDTYGRAHADKIHVIHCGIEPEEIVPAQRPAAPAGQLRLLGVGQLNRRKGFHILLAALSELQDRNVDFHCTIVGEGAERRDLEQLIARNNLGDRVHLAGALLHEDVKRELGRADAFVLPCVISEDGWRDGIPVALMEAMAYELPVVSTDILGLPELIEHDVSGLLVPSGDPSSLADALERLAKDADLRVCLGRSAREKVLRDFNNPRSVKRLKKLFEELAA